MKLRVMVLALGFGAALPTLAHAAGDAVDEAYARGTQAAADGDWAGAAASWEEARRILPDPNAQLSYDLGTAYAHLGELGFATIHLERARRAEPALEQDARRNLAIVRRQAEISAAAESRELSQATGWSDRLLAAFASPAMAWLALVAGWLSFAGWLVRRRVDASTRGANGLGALTLLAALIFLITALGHALARDSAAVTGELIVLHEGLEAREGPGSHQSAAFAIAAGSRVLEEERRSGWVMVRLPGGLAGWVESDGVARIDAPEGQVPLPSGGGDI
jgi:tetratricopeptide (TPR) repeat protein